MKTVCSRLFALSLALSLLSHAAPELPVVAPEPDSKLPTMAKYLNRGGSLYLCMDTGQWAAKLGQMVAKLEALTWEALHAEDKEDLELVVYFLNAFVRDSGLRRLAGVGASSVETAAGVYHNRLFLQHAKDGAKGLLWDALTAENRSLDLLQRLPATTAYARWGVVKPEPVWGWIKATVDGCGKPDVIRDFHEELARMRTEDGADLDRWSGSVTGGIGVVVTLDPSKVLTVATGWGKTLEFPSVAAAFLLEVEDDTLFEAIGEQFAKEEPEAKRVDRQGLSAYIFPEAKLGDNGHTRATVARFGPYLVFSTSDELVTTLAAKTGSLLATPEFQRYHAAMPTEGFAFRYVHPIAGNTFCELMEGTLGQRDLPALATVKGVLSHFRDSFRMSVTLRTPDGVVSVTNQNAPMGLAMPRGVFVTPVLAGMLMPALAQAREKARRISELSNLKQVGVALREYSLAHDGRFPDDLGALLEAGNIKKGKLFVSPSAKTVPPATAVELRSGQCDFLYFGRGRTQANSGPDDPIVCSKPGVHIRYTGVLFGDGHVKGVDDPQNSLSGASKTPCWRAG